MDTWEISIFEYINKIKDEECCGLLTKQGNKTVFFPCKNYAKDKSINFLISPDDWIEIEDKANIIGIVHSHPKGDLNMSEGDIKKCVSLDYPFYLFSIEKQDYKIFYPKDFI